MFGAAPAGVNFQMAIESTITRWWQLQQPRLPWLERLSVAVLAPRCIRCGLSAAPLAVDLCDVCLGDLPFRPLPALEVSGVGAHLYCVPLRYEEPVAGLVRGLKFHADWRAARVLGAVLAASRAASGVAPPQALLPLPLHPARLRERGYNQAQLLASAAARWLGVPVLPRALARVRATPPQTRLDAAARRANLREAFALADAWREGATLPRHVALIDDVVTTGATLADAVRALRRCGVQTVEAWAVARAELATPVARAAQSYHQ
jgi:ComF family protein